MLRSVGEIELKRPGFSVMYRDFGWVDEDGCELKWKDEGVLESLYFSGPAEAQLQVLAILGPSGYLTVQGLP